jgi:hypothetical protein
MASVYYPDETRWDVDLDQDDWDSLVDHEPPADHDDGFIDRSDEWGDEFVADHRELS